MKTYFQLLGLVWLMAGMAFGGELRVFPEITRAIGGVSQVERARYFSICDSGTFDKNVLNDEMYEYFIDELGVEFGRTLGIVSAARKWDKSVREDPARPGFADLEYLRKTYRGAVDEPSERLQKRFAPNLQLAAHDNHNAYPVFVGERNTEQTRKVAEQGGGKTGYHAEFYPENIEAAAELAAAVLKYRYTDFNRPAYFEPVNEPHWSFVQDQAFADWHVQTKKAVAKLTPEVKVGGYCNSTSYFFAREYDSWRSYERFIRNTGGALDFYSFHTYDYFRWEDGTIKGRVQSGLPLENVLDVYAAALTKQLGVVKPLVVSEHGGYITSIGDQKGRYDGDVVSDTIASIYFPKDTYEGSDWEWELKKRSIMDFVHVSSILANTFCFLEHPHVVEKAVPFILFNTWSWNVHYYANLYVPYEYQDRSRWEATQMVAFYKFFRGFDGRRVLVQSPGRDIQVHAAVANNRLFVALHNVSEQSLSFPVKGVEGDNITIRRLGRNSDFTMTYKEEQIDRLGSLKMAPREAVMLIVDKEETIPQRAKVNERMFYGDRYAFTVRAKRPEKIQVELPTLHGIKYAELRIGLAQKGSTAKEVRVVLNGTELELPIERSAERFLDQAKHNEFATLRSIFIPTDLLKKKNQVVVKVLGEQEKQVSVGAVVLRVGYTQ